MKCPPSVTNGAPFVIRNVIGPASASEPATRRIAISVARLRPDASSASYLLHDWYEGLMLRAATSGLGRSARQMERRIKQWTGQPLRELSGISRSEQAFFQTLLAFEQGELNWAELANEMGYTDQSHLCRQTRRLTGFPPDELRRRIAQDEGFWLYRLWGFSEVRHSALDR